MPHDAILVDLANETRLLAIMRSSMHVILITLGERKRFPNHVTREYAIEVDPFSAVLRPSGTTKRLFEAGCGDGLLQWLEVLTRHVLDAQLYL